MGWIWSHSTDKAFGKAILYLIVFVFVCFLFLAVSALCADLEKKKLPR